MMRLAPLFFALLALCFWGCTGAPKSAADSAVTASADAPGGKHFFWKVSDDNSSVWLLGSVHFADSTFYPLDAVIDSAFEKADELAVEINLSDDDVNEDVAQQTMRRGILPPGKTLDAVLPRAVWNSIDSICASWNFPVAGLMQMRPWLAATTLSVVAIQRAGINPEYGIDVVLMDRAATGGKAIVSLETAEEQVDAISDTDDSDSAGTYYLKTTLREISELDSMVTKMMRAWKTGDENLLREVMNDEPEDASDSDKKIKDNIDQKMYLNRNAKMAESVAKFLAEDRNVFVVVGAAHLVLEKDNVVERLRKKGLKVERF